MPLIYYVTYLSSLKSTSLMEDAQGSISFWLAKLSSISVFLDQSPFFREFSQLVSILLLHKGAPLHRNLQISSCFCTKISQSL